MKQPVLFDRYQFDKQLGQGGMAEVFLAKDLILDRPVAIKQLLIDKRNDEESIDRFNREAESTAELMHPHIVRIYDVQDSPYPFIAMEYIEGTDLKQYIKEHTNLDLTKIVTIMDQILSAIEYAHEKNIIHRDIKPQNILIDQNDQIKVTDFGIAIVLSQNSITRTNSLLGTVHYISPEQARGGVITKQSDIYSLGIVLYELLTGFVPYDGESAVSIAIQHIQDDFPDIEDSVGKTIPQALKNIVLKSTQKNSSQRYQSIREMRNDLKSSLDPKRKNEPPFQPNENLEETMVLKPINKERTAGNSGKTLHDNKDSSQLNEKNTNLKKKLWLLLPLLILFVLFIGLAVYGRGLNSSVTLPDFQGLTPREAELRLEDLNLIVDEQISRPHDATPEGLVIGTNPESGTRVEENSEIDLFISTGSETIQVEDYQGRNFEEVRAELTELGFTVNQVEEASNEFESGTIIRQDIEPGQEVKPEETTIELRVSSGPQGINLRDLRGYSRTSVKDYLNQHNLRGNIEEEASQEVPVGQVICQSPAPGTQVFEGDTVTFVFSTGPDSVPLRSFSHQITVPYQPPLQSSANDPIDEQENQVNVQEEGLEEDSTNGAEEADGPNGELSNRIQIFINDAETNMNQPVLDFEIVEDTQVVLNFVVEEGQEEASYRVVRDGQIIMEEEVQASE